MKEKYFYGYAVSEEGLKRGLVDYDTLRKATRAFTQADYLLRYLEGKGAICEIIQGDCYNEYCSFCLVDKQGADILIRHTKEYLKYYPEIDCYFWGIPFCNIGWTQSMTDIALD